MTDQHHAPQQLAFPFYRVKLDIFEGPLDLLLHLIKKNEVEITDIPIAAITEQYLGYLEMMRELSLDVAGEFLVMAATLMLIKSRMLLPPSEEEEPEENDPRAELVQQLLEYQRYREAALDLSERPLLHRDVFVREPAPPEPEEMADLPEEPLRLRVSVWDLMEAFRAVLARARPEAVHEVAVETVSLRDCAHAILRRLETHRAALFESLFPPEATRLEIVVTFLALLELMKMGAVHATQEVGFGPIQIELAVEDIQSVSFGVLDDYGGALPSVAAAAQTVPDRDVEGVEDGGAKGNE
jgi:segregation and condensation protein A